MTDDQMEPRPDRRWEYILGGVTDRGLQIPMSFSILQGLAAEWAEMLPEGLPQEGPVALLRTARSLFAHSWFDYEFMVVACMVGFQAVDAAFHELYEDANDKTPLRHLVDRAEDEGVLPLNIAELAGTAVELRNMLSHPATAGGWTVGMAGGVLENTHRLVAIVLAAAEGRRGATK